MSQISKELFIGNLYDAKDFNLLKKKGITHILCAAGELKPNFPNEFEYLTLNGASDHEDYNLSKDFDRAADFINKGVKQGGKVLVHCAAGISRSTSCMMAYLMKHRGMKLLDAYKLCKSGRAIVNPNEGFKRQLEGYEKSLISARKEKLDRDKREAKKKEEMLFCKLRNQTDRQKKESKYQNSIIGAEGKIRFTSFDKISKEKNPRKSIGDRSQVGRESVGDRSQLGRESVGDRSQLGRESVGDRGYNEREFIYQNINKDNREMGYISPGRQYNVYNTAINSKDSKTEKNQESSQYQQKMQNKSSLDPRRESIKPPRQMSNKNYDYPQKYDKNPTYVAHKYPSPSSKLEFNKKGANTENPYPPIEANVQNISQAQKPIFWSPQRQINSSNDSNTNTLQNEIQEPNFKQQFEPELQTQSKQNYRIYSPSINIERSTNNREDLNRYQKLLELDPETQKAERQRVIIAQKQYQQQMKLQKYNKMKSLPVFSPVRDMNKSFGNNNNNFKQEENQRNMQRVNQANVGQINQRYQLQSNQQNIQSPQRSQNYSSNQINQNPQNYYNIQKTQSPQNYPHKQNIRSPLQAKSPNCIYSNIYNQSIFSPSNKNLKNQGRSENNYASPAIKTQKPHNYQSYDSLSHNKYLSPAMSSNQNYINRGQNDNSRAHNSVAKPQMWENSGLKSLNVGMRSQRETSRKNVYASPVQSINSRNNENVASPTNFSQQRPRQFQNMILSPGRPTIYSQRIPSQPFSPNHPRIR